MHRVQLVVSIESNARTTYQKGKMMDSAVTTEDMQGFTGVSLPVLPVALVRGAAASG